MVGPAVVEVGAVRLLAGCPDPPLAHATRTIATQTASARSSRCRRGKRVDAAADVPIVPSPGVGPTVSVFEVSRVRRGAALMPDTLPTWTGDGKDRRSSRASASRRAADAPSSARGDGRMAGDADRAAAIANRVQVAAVWSGAEREAAVAVGPGDLAADAAVAVAKRSWGYLATL
jgi:hypothetical protein